MARVEVILDVPSVEKTVEWYETILGWKGGFDVYDKNNNCLFGEVVTKTAGYEKEQGIIGFNLARSDSGIEECGCNWQALIYVDDVQSVYQRVLENGWSVESDLEDQPWGGRTFNLVDLNGVRLRFAQMIESPSIDDIQQRLNNQ
jgi:predicted enzyme related to lactoylglutathione lyase